MKKKLTALIFALLIMTTLIQPTAHASTFSLNSMHSYMTFNFADKAIQKGDIIFIDAGAQNVKLVGDPSVTYYDVMINLESHGGCKFIIENLNITGMYGDNTTPIVVHGTGNTMEVRGTCNILAPVDVGIQVESGDELTITGNGTLNVRGGYNIQKAGAGIGGRYQENSGTVNFKGSVKANVEGGTYASAIGGGGGYLEILGYHPWSRMHPGGNGGSVNVFENAIVYADGSSSHIGAGTTNSNSGTLSVSGNAAVFFRTNEQSTLPSLNLSSNHSYIAGGYKFGYSVSGNVGASITTKSLCTITYDANGGTGSKSSKYEQDKTVTLYDGTAFMRDGYTLTGWASSADGIKDYDLSESFTLQNSDVTLYAAWSPYDISYDLDGGTNNASNPATYETVSTPIALTPPSKDGCTFIGWYDGADFSSANKVSEVPLGTAGNLKYYAKWNTIPTLKPEIVESVSESVMVNNAYSIRLTDFFIDADGDTLSYLVSVNGGAFSAVSADFSCIPAVAGITDLYFKASDGNADSVKVYHVKLTAVSPTQAPTSVPTPTKPSSHRTHSPSMTAAPTQTADPSQTTASAASEIPSPALTPSATALPSATAMQESAETATPAVITTDVKQDEDGETVIVIDTNSLPDGTEAVKMPDGRIIPIDSAQGGSVTIKVTPEMSGSDGTVTLVMLGEDQTALGYYNVAVPSDNKGPDLPLWLIILGGGVVLFWAVYAVAWVNRTKTNPRYIRR